MTIKPVTFTLSKPLTKKRALEKSQKHKSLRRLRQ